MGVLLRMQGGRTGACLVFHGPAQKELVRLIPSSLTVQLGYRAAAHVPGSLHRVLLRREKFSTGGYLDVSPRAVRSLSARHRVCVPSILPRRVVSRSGEAP